MVRAFTTTLLAALALYASSSAATPPYQQGPVQNNNGATPANSFIAAEAPSYNNAVVSDLLSNAKKLRRDGEAYAALDWDNTCMYGDISYTSVSYQVDNLNFRLPPTQFQEAFSLGYTCKNGDECLPLGVNSVLGTDVNGTNVTVKAALASTAQDYKTLFDLYIGPKYGLTPGAAPSLETVKATDAFKNFRAKIAFLSLGLEGVYGTKDRLPCAIKIGMTVLPQLLVGMTEPEIRTLIKSSVRWNLAAKLEAPSFISGGDLAVKGSYTTGLRVFNGQETTMRALHQQGVAVYVISASPQVFADEIASFMGLTFLVPRSNVYGVRFTYNDNKLTGKAVDKYPITWGPGKAEIVEKYITPKHKGKAPIFASGDANGDCDFMDKVRDGVVHVNNRLKDNSNCIQGFNEKSCQFYGEKDAKGNKYLLQGQDKEIGSWIPTGFTTKDGVTYIPGTVTFANCSSYGYNLEQ